jgi:hypothetical protein
MRKINLKKTNTNVRRMVANEELYGFYGLTENSDYDKYQDNYVREHFRFSCEGSRNEREDVTKMFVEMLEEMQAAYLKAMNVTAPLFKITRTFSKVAPYGTIVIDIDVEGAKGAFATIVNCAGPDLHQFHASGIWVRANEDAGVWKSLFYYNDSLTSTTSKAFNWIDEDNANKWLDKVKSARVIAKDCIKAAGEPGMDEKKMLVDIMTS